MSRFAAKAILEEETFPVSTAKDYWELTKPRVMSLVLFTGLTGLLALPASPSFFKSFLILLGLALSAGGSGVLNMALEDAKDKKMERTQSRPIPAERITKEDGLVFGIFLIALSLLIYGLGINWKSSIVLGFTSFFYVVIYTLWLKPCTDQNIVIGGLAGALPPFVAWYAGGGDPYAFKPWFMVGLIFLWTPPHFWALALLRSEEYKRAGFPMLPITKGESYTRSAIFIYTGILVLWSFLPLVFEQITGVYKGANLLLGGVFLYKAYLLRKDKSPKSLKSFFGLSILYLFGEFTLLLYEWGIV